MAGHARVPGACGGAAGRPAPAPRPVVLAPRRARAAVFLVAYHTINPYPIDVRHYRAHFAYFFVTGFVFLVAAVGTALARTAHGRARRRAGSWLGPLAVGALLVSQLPTTYAVATQDDVPDYGMAGQVLRTDLPPDALVLYDGPAPAGRWRVPFFGKPRYSWSAPRTSPRSRRCRRAAPPRRGRPGLPADRRLLLRRLGGVRDEPEVHWSGRVEGFRVARRFSMFMLTRRSRASTAPPAPSRRSAGWPRRTAGPRRAPTCSRRPGCCCGRATATRRRHRRPYCAGLKAGTRPQVPEEGRVLSPPRRRPRDQGRSPLVHADRHLERQLPPLPHRPRRGASCSATTSTCSPCRRPRRARTSCR